MTVTDQIKIYDIKIMQNEPQHDLDRKAAKMSALSSNDLNKYEYLTVEDVDLKPGTVEQAKAEYSELVKHFILDCLHWIKRRRQKRRTFEETKKY